jgi:hypothetical protein
VWILGNPAVRKIGLLWHLLAALSNEILAFSFCGSEFELWQHEEL